jgi:hypothetical protein
MRAEVGPDIREAFTARSEEPAQRLFDLGTEKYENKASTLAAWMIDNIPIDSACSAFPDRIASGCRPQMRGKPEQATQTM